MCLIFFLIWLVAENESADTYFFSVVIQPLQR